LKTSRNSCALAERTWRSGSASGPEVAGPAVRKRRRDVPRRAAAAHAIPRAGRHAMLNGSVKLAEQLGDGAAVADARVLHTRGSAGRRRPRAPSGPTRRPDPAPLHESRAACSSSIVPIASPGAGRSRRPARGREASRPPRTRSAWRRCSRSFP
jgi:hypothetical protein